MHKEGKGHIYCLCIAQKPAKLQHANLAADWPDRTNTNLSPTVQDTQSMERTKRTETSSNHNDWGIWKSSRTRWFINLTTIQQSFYNNEAYSNTLSLTCLWPDNSLLPEIAPESINLCFSLSGSSGSVFSSADDDGTAMVPHPQVNDRLVLVGSGGNSRHCRNDPFLRKIRVFLLQAKWDHRLHKQLIYFRIQTCSVNTNS